jgi:chromate transporter
VTGADAAASAPSPISFWSATGFWTKLGFLSFGGPAGQIALMHRTWGGLVAGTLFVLPSLLILIALSWIYVAYGHEPLVAGLFYGIKPAVTAIVVQAAHRIGSRTLKNSALWAIIAAAALVGYIGGQYAPEQFKAGVDR